MAAAHSGAGAHEDALHERLARDAGRDDGRREGPVLAPRPAWSEGGNGGRERLRGIARARVLTEGERTSARTRTTCWWAGRSRVAGAVGREIRGIGNDAARARARAFRTPCPARGRTTCGGTRRTCPSWSGTTCRPGSSRCWTSRASPTLRGREGKRGQHARARGPRSAGQNRGKSRVPTGRRTVVLLALLRAVLLVVLLAVPVGCGGVWRGGAGR